MRGVTGEEREWRRSRLLIAHTWRRRPRESRRGSPGSRRDELLAVFSKRRKILDRCFHQEQRLLAVLDGVLPPVDRACARKDCAAGDEFVDECTDGFGGVFRGCERGETPIESCWNQSGLANDPAAPDDVVAIVEDRRLAGSDGTLGNTEPDAGPVAIQRLNSGRRALMRVTNLDGDLVRNLLGRTSQFARSTSNSSDTAPPRLRRSPESVRIDVDDVERFGDPPGRPLRWPIVNNSMPSCSQESAVHT